MTMDVWLVEMADCPGACCASLQRCELYDLSVTYFVQVWNYRTAGNVCGNNVVRFHAKTNGHLLAKLNFAFWDHAVLTPHMVMAMVTIDSCVRGRHVFKPHGSLLSRKSYDAAKKTTTPHNLYAMVMIRGDAIVGHVFLRFLLQATSFLRRKKTRLYLLIVAFSLAVYSM